jgi:hypothetical protein
MNVMGARRVCVLVLICFTAIARISSAATIGFEGPTYSLGSVIGQDGWVANSYTNAGNQNGTAEVSAVSPLVGSQSLLYTQTIAGGLRDISRPSLVTVKESGTTAIDAVGSFRIQVADNSLGSGRSGAFFSYDGFNGQAQAGVQITGVTAAGGGLIQPVDFGAGGFSVAAQQPYVANDVLEFVVGLNFDNLDYELSYRNLTTGGPLTPMTGGTGPGGRFRFNGNAFPDDGDGVSYTVDTLAFLRSGTSRIDNFTLAQVPEPTSAILLMAGLATSCFSRSRRSPSAI